jgi:hypothetical protein
MAAAAWDMAKAQIDMITAENPKNPFVSEAPPQSVQMSTLDLACIIFGKPQPRKKE